MKKMKIDKGMVVSKDFKILTAMMMALGCDVTV